MEMDIDGNMWINGYLIHQEASINFRDGSLVVVFVVIISGTQFIELQKFIVNVIVIVIIHIICIIVLVSLWIIDVTAIIFIF